MAALSIASAMGGWTGAAQAQEEPAVVRRVADLREQPAEAGRTLASLPADTAITRLAERQGPWVRVRTAAGATGWLHMFDLGAPTWSAPSAASGVLRSVTGLFKSSAPATVSTSTLGIRGLGAEDLAKAQPDTGAVTRAEALRVSEQQARQFARDSRWEAVAVEPLAASAPAAATPQPGVQQ